MKKERQYVINAYPSPNWKKQVDKMADDQVIAIYFRLKQNENSKRTQIIKPDDPDDQLRLF